MQRTSSIATCIKLYGSVLITNFFNSIFSGFLLLINVMIVLAEELLFSWGFRMI